MLAAVGPLQFEVVQYRLQSEYGAESKLEQTPWNQIRWFPKGFNVEAVKVSLPTGSKIAFDTDNNAVVLFTNDWSVGYFGELNPKIELEKLPPERLVDAAEDGLKSAAAQLAFDRQ